MSGEVIELKQPAVDLDKAGPVQVNLRAVFADNRDMAVSLTLSGSDTKAHNAILDHVRVLINRQAAMADLPGIEAEIDKHEKAIRDENEMVIKADADTEKKIEALMDKMRRQVEDNGTAYDKLRHQFYENRRDSDGREFDPNAPRVKNALEAGNKAVAEIQAEIDKLRQEQSAFHEGRTNNIALYQGALEKLYKKRDQAQALIT